MTDMCSICGHAPAAPPAPPAEGPWLPRCCERCQRPYWHGYQCGRLDGLNSARHGFGQPVSEERKMCSNPSCLKCGRTLTRGGTHAHLCGACEIGAKRAAGETAPKPCKFCGGTPGCGPTLEGEQRCDR